MLIVCLYIVKSPLYVLSWPPKNIDTSYAYLVTVVTGSRKGQLNRVFCSLSLTRFVIDLTNYNSS